MPIYRRAYAELRRLHRDAEWELTAVVVAGGWHSVVPGTRRAPSREMQAGLVAYAELPDLIAPDDREAVARATWLAIDAGLRPSARRPQAGGRRGPRTHRLSHDVP